MESAVTAEMNGYESGKYPTCTVSTTMTSAVSGNQSAYLNGNGIMYFSSALSGCSTTGPINTSVAWGGQPFCITPGYQHSGPNTTCALANPAMVQCGSGPGFQSASVIVSSKTVGESPCCTAGNPIGVSTGNKFQKEVDYPAIAGGHLTFARYYNSDIHVPTGSVQGPWRGEYDRSIVLSTDPSFGSAYTGAPYALAYRKDGRVITFNISGSVPVATDSDTVETLAQTSTGWALTNADDSIEIYTTVASVASTGPTQFGQLTQINFQTGGSLYLTYNATQQLITVTDSFGRSLALTYNGTSGTSSTLATMTDSAGNLFTYQYYGSGLGAESGLLETVTYPGPTLGSSTGAPVRTYEYTQPNAPYGGYFLSGILDESGVNYATWTYTAGGLANRSYHGSYQDSYSLQFASNGYGYPGTGTTVTDGNGRSDAYTFSIINGVPKYTSIKTNNGFTSYATYDLNGNFTSKTDPLGNLTDYSIDVRGLEESRTQAVGTSSARTITTQWHPTLHLPTQRSVYVGGSATGTPVSITSWTYDGSGNLQQKTILDPTADVSRIWMYTYDSYGHVLTAQGPRTDVTDITTYTYNNCTTGYGCGQVATVTNSLGQVTTYGSYNADGYPLTITDPNGVTTTLTYDPQNRLASRSTAGETTTLVYYPTGLLHTITLPDGAALTYGYDTAHRLTQVSDSLGNKITYTLDTMGNRKAENYYDPTNVLDKTINRTFDSLSRLATTIGAANTSAVTTTFSYDYDNNLKTVAAPLSRTTSNTYDVLNRLAQVVDPASGVTQYQYDTEDDLTQVTDPRGLATTYQYNGLSDLMSLTSPDTGTATYTYDSGGNLATATDARSVVATFTYDAANRRSTASYVGPAGSDPTITFSYDSGTNGLGRLTGASDAYHSVTWGYDALGRVASKTQTVSGVAATVGYQYANGDLTQLTTPSGQVVTYGYTNHAISAISVNGTAVVASVVYEPFGPARGWTWGNNTSEVRLYNTDGNPSQVGGP